MSYSTLTRDELINKINELESYTLELSGELEATEDVAEVRRNRAKNAERTLVDANKRINELEGLLATIRGERGELVVGVDDIVCRNGVKHGQYEGCQYCRVDHLEAALEQYARGFIEGAYGQPIYFPKEVAVDALKYKIEKSGGETLTEIDIEPSSSVENKQINTYDLKDANGSCGQCGGPEFHSKYCVHGLSRDEEE